MSKASKWVASGSRRDDQPMFGAPGMIFGVGKDNEDKPALDVKGGWHTIEADQALALAHWILDTFGETP